MTRQQRTLRSAVEFEGVGLHSGELVKVRVLPAGPDSGIEFVRKPIPR